MESLRSEIPGSAPVHAEREQNPAAVAPDRQIAATIFVRRRPEISDLGAKLHSGTFDAGSREDAAAWLSADPKDLAAIESFAREYGLRVTFSDAAKRSVKVEGSVQDFNRAFGINLGLFGGSISYSGPISVPESLSRVIVAVLGLDNRPIARPAAQ